MPLRWFESDGSTPLGALNLEKVAPGEDYITKYSGPKQIVLKNTGDTNYASVAIEIAAVSTFPANEYVRIATGDTEPSSGDYVDHEDSDLAIGTLNDGDSAKVWIDVVVPAQASRGVGQVVNLRAYGEES